MSPSVATRERSGPRHAMRTWLFRLAAMTLLPALLLLLVECGLRTAGYGYPTQFFLQVRARDAYTGNPRFGWRFFPRSLSRVPVLMDLPATKAPGTYRIFVLGGSAAQGTPEPSFSFGRILESMLKESYPDARFEVINAAMTAINSHVVLPIARDCARHEPDLFVVYMGNNEVVGPFGPGTVFNRSSRSLAMVRAGLWLKTMKVGQAMQALAGRLPGSAGQAADWRGMEMFLEQQVTAADSRLETVYQYFGKNLEDICAVATGAGADVLLCTLPVSLKDSPPFASLHGSGLDPAQQSAWERAYSAGREREAQGDYKEAQGHYYDAAIIDDGFAELSFRLAACHLALGRTDEAREAYKKARDLDTLRFRADTHINNAIRRVAAGKSADSLALVDAERAYEQPEDSASHGIAGREFFHDHVHLTFEGNYKLASMVFEKAARFVSRSFNTPDGPSPSPPSLDLCAERLAYTGPDRYRMASAMWTTMGRPPFTHQGDHLQRREQAYRAWRSLATHAAPDALKKAEEVYRRAVERAGDDLLLQRNFAQILSEVGQLREAEEQWTQLLARLPDNADAHADFGEVLLAMGRKDDARHHFELALRAAVAPAEYCNRIGETLTKSGALELAESYYRQGLEYESGSAKLHNNLGSVLFQQQKPEDALDEFFEAVKLSPSDVIYLNNLGVTLFLCDRPADAVTYLAKAVELDPFYAPAQDRLALVLARLGSFDEAARHLAEALRLEPENPEFQAHHAELTRLLPSG